VAEVGAAVDGGRSRIDGDAVFYEIVGGALAATGRASPGSAAGQVMAPGTVVGAADLGVDEAVDALVADGYGGVLLEQAAGDLLGRPADLELAEDEAAQPGIALQARACPSPGAGLLVGIARPVALRFSSRATVDGARSRSAAISRIDCPSL